MNTSVPGAAIAAMLTRWIVAIAAGYLAGHHVIDETQVPAFIQDGIAAVPAGLVLLWSYREKVWAVLKQIAAAKTGNANPEKDQVKAVAAKVAILLILIPAMGLSGCTAQAKLTPYEQFIQNACADILPLAQATPDALAVAIKAVGAVKYGVIGGCSTLNGIIAMAKSATTKQWLDTAQTVLKTQGAVLPAPVAPVPLP